MSRVVKIKGKVLINNTEVANKSIRELGLSKIKIVNNTFVFEGYDYYDGLNKFKEISDLENRYLQNLKQYEIEIERQMKLLEEQKKFEELKRLEEEMRRAEEERKRLQAESLEKIKINAKKNGYKIKQQVSEDNKIKLVLVKRVY